MHLENCYWQGLLWHRRVARGADDLGSLPTCRQTVESCTRQNLSYPSRITDLSNLAMFGPSGYPVHGTPSHSSHWLNWITWDLDRRSPGFCCCYFWPWLICSSVWRMDKRLIAICRPFAIGLDFRFHLGWLDCLCFYRWWNELFVCSNFRPERREPCWPVRTFRG